MKVYRTRNGIVIEQEGTLYLSDAEWNHFVNRKNLYDRIQEEIKTKQNDASLAAAIENSLLPPIDSQEIWASGVTYMRSKEARMEEAKQAGGGDFYARVYDAERPELFFKSTASRAVGSGDKVRIRRDSKWNVPEPELTLFMCSEGTIEGYTIGNDMSSRDIEGENPLYLPQAKSYDGAAAIGPCLYVPPSPINPDTQIDIEIRRSSAPVFQSNVSINRMKRRHTELAEYLFRETSFPYGAYLMTGTGIVPPDDFTLEPGDEIRISIENIGTLVNTVTRK
jgi:2-dehydro-3-deoxy-D-arabinonate dehydratase